MRHTVFILRVLKARVLSSPAPKQLWRWQLSPSSHNGVSVNDSSFWAVYDEHK